MYGCSYERMKNGIDGSESTRGDKKVEIAWHPVYRRVSFVLWIGRGPEDDGGMGFRDEMVFEVMVFGGEEGLVSEIHVF